MHLLPCLPVHVSCTYYIFFISMSGSIKAIVANMLEFFDDN